MLLSLDLNEHLINEEGVTMSLLLPSQSLCIFRSENFALEENGLVADSHVRLGQ